MSFVRKSTLALGASGAAALFLAAALLTPGAQSVATAQETATQAPAPVAHTIDAVHSSVVFRVKHANTAWVFGRFNQFSGTVNFHPENPAASSIDVTIQAESVDTAHEGRDRHLRSNDFFSVTEHPTLTFKSTSITHDGNGIYTLVGDVTLLGVTKPVEASFTITGQGANRQGVPMVGAMAEFVVTRSDFGMTYNLGGLSDDIHVIVSLEAVENR